MPSSFPHFILAYHGTDQSIAQSVIATPGSQLQPSENAFDWLGHGIYFWENDPQRALEYAQTLMENPKRSKIKITKPAVIGAVIDLGNCLNLLDREGLQLVKKGYEILEVEMSESGESLPKNKPIKESKSDELLLRELDCAVINRVHGLAQASGIEPFDTVRGAFWEGEELYPNAGFAQHNHIQVCVRNEGMIQGFFHPRELR